jgi:hypothetical protein
MSENADVAVSSLEESINSWPALFKDLNNGGDTRNWHKLAMKELAPAAIFGQAIPGVALLPPVFRPDERTQISFPAFFDTDPAQSGQPTPAGVKLKFNGKTEKGLLVVTDTSIKTAYVYGRGVVAAELPRSVAIHVGAGATKFSMLSMTSAGSTYEVLFVEDGETVRIMFRVALEPRNRDFTDVAESDTAHRLSGRPARSSREPELSNRSNFMGTPAP